MSLRGAAFATALLVASGIAGAQAPADREERERVMRLLETGHPTVLDKDSESVKAAAREAVSAHAAASGANLELVSITDAWMLVTGKRPMTFR